MQSPGGPEEDPSAGFVDGGWMVPYFDGDMQRVLADKMAGTDAVLLGRRSYEILAGYWPNVGDEDPGAAILNRVPKYVVSTTLSSGHWRETTVIKDDVVAQIAELKRKPGRELQVHGSGGLVQTLLAHDLVDEFRLWTFPVVVGSGRRLFADGAHPAGLTLTESVTTSAGAIFGVYEPSGKPSYGTFAAEAPPAPTAQ
jgi:dihydrofolate reductase